MDDGPEEEARPKPQLQVSPSPMIFGRSKRQRPNQDDINQRTPSRSPFPANVIPPTQASPINLSQKNIRALVYQDKSANKQANKSPLAKSKQRPSKNLSISSEDDNVSSDSNRPENDKDDDTKSEKSQNKNSKTLKKQTKKQEADLQQIQTRKTKVAKQSTPKPVEKSQESILISQINEDLRQLKEQ